MLRAGASGVQWTPPGQARAAKEASQCGALPFPLLLYDLEEGDWAISLWDAFSLSYPLIAVQLLPLYL